MVSMKHGTGRRCAEVHRNDDFQVQALSSVCRALKQSSHLIDNKHNLTETLLSQLIFNLRKHYEVSTSSLVMYKSLFGLKRGRLLLHRLITARTAPSQDPSPSLPRDSSQIIVSMVLYM